jgi:hypothetical protein
MKKIKIILSVLLMTISLSLYSQETKLRVAVFDPSSSGTAIDEGTKVAVREIISSTFVDTGKYTIVERSLLQQVMKEQQFSNTDVVDDSQATELGKLAGANKVVISIVTLVGGRNMLSVKVIDVQTATVDQQKTKVVSSNDLLDAVEPLTLELMGEKANPPSSSAQNSSSPVDENNIEASIAQNQTALSTLFYQSEGKEITFLCKKFPAALNPSIKWTVQVILDDELIWTGDKDGFFVKIKDPKPSVRAIKITVNAKLNDADIPVNGGGIFKINTMEKDYFEFKTNIWNYNVKLQK